MARIIGTGLPSYVTPDRANLRIGINSTTPSHTLDVRGATTGEELLIRNTNAAGLTALVCKDDGGTSRVSFGYGNASYSDSDLRRSFIWLQSSDLSITDATTHFLYVDRANSRIGIGTSAPQNAFDIRTTGAAANVARVQNDSTTGYSTTTYYDSSGNFKFGLGYGNSGVAAPFTSIGFFSLSTSLIFSNGTTTYLSIDTTNVSLGLIGICDASKQGTVQTTDATVTTLLSFTPTADRTVIVKLLGVGRKSDDTQGAGYEVTATFRVTGAGAVTQIGTTSILNGPQEDDAAWAMTLDTDATLIRARVTGVAATTIKWTGAMHWIYGAN